MVLTGKPIQGSGILRPCRRIRGLDDYIVLVRPVTTVGRHPGNDITIPRATVSRTHARVVREDEGYIVEDLGSSNGTYLKGKPVRRVSLQNLDRIAFGDVEFTFHLDEETSHSEATGDSNVYLEKRRNGNGPIVVHTQAVSTPEKALAEISAFESVEQAAAYLKAHYQMIELIRQRPAEERMLEGFLDLLLEVIEADCGVILLTNEEDVEECSPTTVRVKDERGEHDGVRISSTIVTRCVTDRLAIISHDPITDDRFSGAESISDMHVRCAMCVPMISRHHLFGVCYLDSQKSASAFTDSDLSFVANLSSQLAIAIENLRMARERQRAEQLMVIGQTISEISHSMRNILSVTQASVDLTEKHVNDDNVEKIKRSWPLVKQGMQRINSFAQDMLDYSRKEKYHPSDTNINDVVEEVARGLKNRTQASAITIEVNLGENLPTCCVDKRHLYDAIMNLAINAIHAVQDVTGARIRLTTTPAEYGVAIILSDNGPGIDPEDQQKVFLPFFTTKGAEGNGMGLPMVKKFAHDMGGEISLQSQSGEGTTFNIYLPAATPEEIESDRT